MKRLKINGDTMTTIVVSSLFFCVAVVITGIVLMCYGIDTSSIVSSALTVFGTELGICGIMKIFDKHLEEKRIKEIQVSEREDINEQNN